MKSQNLRPSVPHNGKLSQPSLVKQVSLSSWDDQPDLSDEPDLPEQEINWDEIPDRSEYFVDLLIRLVESIKEHDLRMQGLEAEREILIDEEILVDTVFHQSAEESVRLLIEIGAHAFPGILKNDIARSLFIQAILEWISIIENNIEIFVAICDPAIPIHSARHRLQMIRQRMEHLHVSMPLILLPNSFTQAEISEFADSAHKAGKFDKSLVGSQVRFLIACLLGKNFKINELASASQNNKGRGKDKYPFLNSLLKCGVYDTQK